VEKSRQSRIDDQAGKRRFVQEHSMYKLPKEGWPKRGAANQLWNEERNKSVTESERPRKYKGQGEERRNHLPGGTLERTGKIEKSRLVRGYFYKEGKKSKGEGGNRSRWRVWGRQDHLSTREDVPRQRATRPGGSKKPYKPDNVIGLQGKEAAGHGTGGEKGRIGGAKDWGSTKSVKKRGSRTGKKKPPRSKCSPDIHGGDPRKDWIPATKHTGETICSGDRCRGKRGQDQPTKCKCPTEGLPTKAGNVRDEKTMARGPRKKDTSRTVRN